MAKPRGKPYRWMSETAKAARPPAPPKILARIHFQPGDLAPRWLATPAMAHYINTQWPGLLENCVKQVGSAPEAGKGLPEGDRVQDGGKTHHAEAETAYLEGPPSPPAPEPSPVVEQQQADAHTEYVTYEADHLARRAWDEWFRKQQRDT